MLASLSHVAVRHRRLAGGIAALSLVVIMAFAITSVVTEDRSSGSLIQDSGYIHMGAILLRDFELTRNPLTLLIALVHSS